MVKELTIEKTGLPVAWELKTIADVTKIVAGGTPKTGIKEYWDGLISGKSGAGPITRFDTTHFKTKAKVRI